MQNAHFVAVGCAGEALKTVERESGNKAVMLAGERYIARDLRISRLRIVVVKDQPVSVARKVFGGAAHLCVRRKILATLSANVRATLVHPLRAGCRGFHNAAVEQRIPAGYEVIEPRPSVAEVAVRRPAAPAEVLCSQHHVHAAVDGPVHLLAYREAADRRSITDDRDQESALAVA